MPAETLNQTPLQTDQEAERSRALSAQPGLSGAVPGFQLLRRLGEGAYGAVWLARQEKTGKEVAVKFYTHRSGLDWSLLNREVEKLALLYTSRNIVRLLDVGWQADPPYYVMEYLERGSLETWLANGPPHPDEAVRIIRSVCQALVHAHGRGVLHCDLKPANVLLDADLEPRLCDFGQSRLSTEQRPALGTLFYMAPEQADLHAVPDARWDVYALGALLYHLLTGKAPFRSPEAEERLRNSPTLEARLAEYRRLVMTSPEPKAHWHARGVDRRLAEIVDRCLRRDPNRRYANAQQVLDVLFLRDRHRRLKPLIAMGGIGPGLILFAMFFFAASAINSAVDTARLNLTARALESDVMSVGILATSVDREIQDRMDELMDVAANPGLRDAVLASQAGGWKDRAAFQRILGATRQRVDDRRLLHQRELDVSWFFVDANGFQRWRAPYDSRVIDQRWDHRDYFHGLNRELPEHAGGDDEPPLAPPISEPHLSTAFVSRSTLRTMVALSVPVKDADGNVIGVLARTTHLGQLLSQYEVSIRGRDGVDRTLALADARNGRILDHSRLSEDAIRQRVSGRFDKLVLDEDLARRVAEAGGDNLRVTDYHDPLATVEPSLAGVPWLAAFAPVGATGWTAIVQEQVADVLKPVGELQQRLRLYAWLAFGAAGVVVACMWYFVLKTISERGIRQWSRSADAEGPGTARSV